MSGKKKFKKPPVNQGQKIKTNPSSEPNPNTLHPAFCFKHLVNGYCVESCEKDEKADLAKRLHKLGSMNWGEIQKADRHGFGVEKIERSSLKVAVPSSIPSDANILALRFSGKKPMVGFRKKKIFYVVWLDRDFSVYNHG